MPIKSQTFSAPAYWASYLINNDASGISIEEKEACDKWLAHLSVLEPVKCVNCWPRGFAKYHDAWAFMPYACEVATYQFHRRVPYEDLD